MPLRINMTAAQFNTIGSKITDIQMPPVVEQQALLIDDLTDFIVTEDNDFITLEDE